MTIESEVNKGFLVFSLYVRTMRRYWVWGEGEQANV